MRPVPPESRGTDINNLMFWLQKCTRNQFSEFIELVKTTANEAGEAHEELATTLQEKFDGYRRHDRSGEIRTTYVRS